MKISLLIPTLGNRKVEIKRLLDSLSIQDYKNFEVIVISQANHETIQLIINSYNELQIVHVRLDIKGLSHARNQGFLNAKGDIIVLSDDDCWYHEKSLEIIAHEFKKNKDLDVLLTKIHDFEKGTPYKKYSNNAKQINNKYTLMSKSSIEIAFKKNKVNTTFDERFGLGAQFSCGEEVDFLINNYSKDKTYYFVPEITVYHPKKTIFNIEDRIKAKGALYAKNFNFLIYILVLSRDLLIKRENNIKNFFEGYFSYKRCNKV